ncbi:MAG: hypothetical protein HOP13_00340 [Alphaproteobacteria bacterium]|nr:hypothetical protein [Alphaproteobacteria bacterium]
MVKYDDASWHYGGDFPEDLPDEAGATHIGMFVACALLEGLGSELHTVEFAEDLEKLRKRLVTPGAYFLAQCDGKFTNEDLNDEGNAFTEAYFESKSGEYLSDYYDICGDDLPTPYHFADTWENFDRLRPVISRRFAEWRAAKS